MNSLLGNDNETIPVVKSDLAVRIFFRNDVGFVVDPCVFKRDEILLRKGFLWRS